MPRSLFLKSSLGVDSIAPTGWAARQGTSEMCNPEAIAASRICHLLITRYMPRYARGGNEDKPSKMAISNSKSRGKQPYFGLKGRWLTFWITVACATDMVRTAALELLQAYISHPSVIADSIRIRPGCLQRGGDLARLPRHPPAARLRKHKCPSDYHQHIRHRLLLGRLGCFHTRREDRAEMVNHRWHKHDGGGRNIASQCLFPAAHDCW